MGLPLVACYEHQEHKKGKAPKSLSLNWLTLWLADFLLMTIATTALFALMGGDLLALSLFSAGHRLSLQG